MKLLASIALLSAPGLAHDPGLSSSRVTVAAAAVTAEVAFANADLAATVPGVDTDRDGRIDAAELRAGAAPLRAFAAAGLALRLDGVEVAPREIGLALASNADVALTLRYPRTGSGSVAWSVPAILDLPRGHRHWATIGGEASALLSATRFELSTDPGTFFNLCDTGRTVASALEFLTLGIEHIWIGYDHILFLLGLLAVGRGFRAAAAVITAFTVAHSITLAVASLELVHLPGSLVEPAIAASIVWVGVENLLRKQPRHRWLTTFAFGLVHGFGFASVLAERGLGTAGIAVPLLSFNLGVEVGQLAIAAVVLPLVWAAQRRSWFTTRLLPGLSAAVVAAGLYWLVQRV